MVIKIIKTWFSLDGWNSYSSHTAVTFIPEKSSDFGLPIMSFSHWDECEVNTNPSQPQILINNYFNELVFT